jgi:hypothetical protein
MVAPSLCCHGHAQPAQLRPEHASTSTSNQPTDTDPIPPRHRRGESVTKHTLTHQSDQGDHRRLLAGDEIVRILKFAALALPEAIRFVKNTEHMDMRTGIVELPFFFSCLRSENYYFFDRRGIIILF